MDAKIIRRFITGILMFVLFVTVLITPQNTFAATVKTSKELEKSLEKQYNISITLSKNLLKDDEKAFYNLKLLEEALNKMPKGLIKALVKHFKTKGKATTISLLTSSAKAFGTAAGDYTFETNEIRLYIPSGGSMWGSGTDSYTILHEFGHMLQNALYDLYGSKKLISEFTLLNKNKPYIKESEWNFVASEYEDTYVHSYAATKFDEDFAETFAASIDWPQRFRELYTSNKKAPLIRKSEYIKKLIESKLKIKISQDYWEIYPQVPSKRYKDKLSFISDDFYIDFETPDHNNYAYQYKIKTCDLYYELGSVWVDATKHIKKLQWHMNMSSSEQDKYFMEIEKAEDEFNTFIAKYTSNIDEVKKIKRKDVALILNDLLEHFSLNNFLEDKVAISDCDKLSSKYNNAIKTVVNSGLMNIGAKNKFYPEAFCTYEQAYYAIVEFYKLLCQE